MRNLKKTLVALLVVSMILAGFTGVAGATFTDIAGHRAANKVQKLAALGVLAGYPDGTFKPDNNITRAEFAKIACILAGLKASGDILKNSPSRFADVRAGEWFTGWVNLATSQGYMKGYPDGTFKPQANITNAEVLTVLCRLLGYNDNLPGDWPIEYLVKASELDISKGVTFDGSAPATRANVCWFAEQSLEVDNVEWDKDKEKFTKVSPIETILSEAFEGALKEDALCTGWEISGDKLRISVYAGDGDGGFNPTGADSKTWTVSKDATLNGATHVSGLENRIIDFILNDDDEIIYAEVKAFGSLSGTEAEKISDTRLEINDRTYTVNAGALARVRGKAVSPITGHWDQFGDLVDEVWDDVDGFQRIVALLNSDGEIAYVRSSEIGDPGIVKEANAATRRITFKDGAAGGEATDLSNYNTALADRNKTFIYFRDGKVAELKNIAAGDMLWITPAPDANGYDFKVEARSSRVTGRLEEHNDALTSLKIAGTSYDAWHITSPFTRIVRLSTDGGDEFSAMTKADLEDVLGETVTVYTDGNGYIRAIVSNVEAMEAAQYGVVAEVFGSTSSAGYSTSHIEIFAKDGKLHRYAVNSDSAKLARAKSAAGTIYFDVDDDGANTAVDVEAVTKPLVKFTLQANGAIDKFEIIHGTNVFQIASGAVDDDLDTVTITAQGTFTLSGAVVFDVSAADRDDWEVVGTEDVIDFAKTNAVNVRGYKESDGALTYVAITTPGVVSDVTYAMVMSKGFDADGPFIRVLDDAGATVKKPGKDTIDDGAPNSVWADLGEDDVITYQMSGGQVSQWNFSTPTGTSAKVYSVRTSGTRRIAIGSDTTWFWVDDDTKFWSITGDDPVKINLGDIQALDTVDYKTGVGADASLLKWVVVK